jgi:Chloride channel protein EriC
LIVMAGLFSTRYLGLGLDTIEHCLQGGTVNEFAFLLKAVFTSITLNFGGSGGIVTPIFFIGTTAGNLFAQLFNLDVATFSALGFVALLAGAANTPIAASIMSIELFGPQIAPYAAIACVISFLVTGHRSVYPSQILAFKKSKFIDVETGKEIEDTKIQFNFSNKKEA